MNCPKCGHKYDDSFRFCVNCSEPNPYQSIPQQVTQPRQLSLDSTVIENISLYSVIVGGVLGLSGLLVFFSTFMSWMSVGSMGFGMNISGWDSIVHAGALSFEKSNPVFSWNEGIGWFGGVWTLVIGIAIIVGVVLFFKGLTANSIIFEIVGILGFFIALFNIVMVLWKMKGASEYAAMVSVGMGLWIFLFFSLVVAVLGFINRRHEGVYW